jgi:hypothetical protein
MTIFDLTIGRVLSLIEAINRFLFETPVAILKATGFLFSLLITALMILYWLKIEKETKDEISFWQTLIRNWKDYYFLQKPNKNFEEIKKIFYQNHAQGLIELNRFFDFALEVFGYGGNLEEKLNKVSMEILSNLEEIKKAYQIVRLIEEKLKKQEDLNLDEDEYLLIFHEYEKALLNLNILTIEDFLVKNLK